MHRELVLEYFGLDNSSSALNRNGDKEDRLEVWDLEENGNSDAEKLANAL